jgi:internalin A
MFNNPFSSKAINKLIEQAKKEGWEHLQVDGNFTDLPSGISELTNLEDVTFGTMQSISPEGTTLHILTHQNTERYRENNLERVNYVVHKIPKINGSFPKEIFELSQLKTLKLLGKINLGVTALDEICSLHQLQYLFLYNANLGAIPPSIKNLQKLKRASFMYGNLKSVPSEIGFLKGLESLELDDNEISVLPNEIGNLASLRKLNVSNNSLSDLPPELEQLPHLEMLFLSNNKFTSIPPIVEKLPNLKKLSFKNYDFPEIPLDHQNKISTLPAGLLNLNNLDDLDLEGNPLPIPPEILEKRENPPAILSYYFSLSKQQRKSINEIKLLVVGQGAVGKTSLTQQILRGSFDKNQTKTEGISISQWRVNNQSEIKSNIWDFGGQEIMHATHQFFLTKRSLYLLVLDSRLTQGENRVEYWLKIIQSFGGESPVLIVGNKIDQHPLDIDRTGLQKKYPNIVGILETSAATGAGIEELKSAITEQVNNLPHVRDLLPETWFTVKTKLEGLGRESNFITHDKYLDLCAENEVSDETSQRTLIGFLHDLGVVLHFQDDPRLEALGILNPQWVTNGVYKILNSHTLFQNKGVLTTSMLDEILNLPEYPRGKRLFIVDMMKKFELCYDIEPDKIFLVPDLLPKDQPDLKFNGVPAFEYAYPVLPSSVITRFIVRMNQKIDDGFVWRTGVALKIGENKALVKADIEDRKITIAIDGLEHTRRDALSAIRYQLDEIHNSIKGLNPEKRVPIPEAPNAEAIEYDYLLMLEREGQETHLIKDGTRLVKVNVRQVLSAIETENQRKEQGGNVTHIYVGGNFDGNLTVGDGNQSIKDSYNKISTAKIDPELKQTLQQLVEAVETMTKSMSEEQATEVTEDLGKLVDEATKSKPNKKWYSVSIEGLIKAAENLDKLGTPVISLSRKVLSLLTGGVVK